MRNYRKYTPSPPVGRRADETTNCSAVERTFSNRLSVSSRVHDAFASILPPLRCYLCVFSVYSSIASTPQRITAALACAAATRLRQIAVASDYPARVQLLILLLSGYLIVLDGKAWFDKITYTSKRFSLQGLLQMLQSETPTGFCISLFWFANTFRFWTPCTGSALLEESLKLSKKRSMPNSLPGHLRLPFEPPGYFPQQRL